MAGIIPKTIAGALDYTSTRVENAAAPAAPFVIDCDYLALPSDCTARILPSQINAIVSELVNLGACFDPDGEWDCSALDNLCNLFTRYRTDTTLTDGTVNLVNDIQTLICGLPEADMDENSRLLFCDGDGNIRKLEGGGNDAECLAIVTAICASDTCKQTLVACLISTDPGNALAIATTDSLLYVPSWNLQGSATFTANDRDLRDQNPNPTFGCDVLNIPNNSPYPIDVMLSIKLAVDLIQDIAQASGAISFSVFQGPGCGGGVFMDTQIGIPNVPGAGDFSGVSINMPPIRCVTVPPGGLDVYVGFQGGASPDRGMSIRNAQGRISWWGQYAASADGVNCSPY